MKDSQKVLSERNVLKATIDKILIKLNNYLMAANLPERYKLTWEKGEGEISNNIDRNITYYYSLKLDIWTSDAVIPIYAGHYPIKTGSSMIHINEAETKAYTDVLTHGIGALITVQHSMYLQLAAAEKAKATITKVEEDRAFVLDVITDKEE